MKSKVGDVVFCFGFFSCRSMFHPIPFMQSYKQLNKNIKMCV